jgi:non-heme chloroperoxidase
MKLPARVWRDVAAGFPRHGLYEDVSQIASPALLLWGDRDAITPRTEQEAFLRALPTGRLEVYEGIGHALHWEQPERFAADVTAFAREVAL